MNTRSLPLTIFVLTIVTLSACKSDKSPDDLMKAEPAPVKGDTDTVTRKSNVVETIYEIKDLDMPPLWDSSCVQDESPTKCNNQKIAEYIKSKVKSPADAQRSEVISFIVKADGSISDNIKSISKKEVCQGCRAAAIDVVNSMRTWTPAQKDGKPVAARMVVAVPFS